MINEHDLHIKRLQWEFEQRQTQQQQCDEVEKNKETILSEIQEESRILQSILPMLKDIRSVSLSFYNLYTKYRLNKKMWKFNVLKHFIMYQTNFLFMKNN